MIEFKVGDRVLVPAERAAGAHGRHAYTRAESVVGEVEEVHGVTARVCGRWFSKSSLVLLGARARPRLRLVTA